jgi:DNA polymerase III delta prime subunit
MSIAAQLEEARRALIDLSTRNRLLSLPAQGRSRGVIRIEDEDAGFVVQQLAAGRGFGFEAAVAGEAKGRKRAEGVATASGSATREEWRRDTQLRVALAPEELTRRLRDVMADARSAREESGVPSLFLAVGALVWRDPGTPATERMAPLALIPATLERDGVSARFRLRASPEDVMENLSLREKLATDFRITLPDFAGEGPADWAARMQAALGEGREGWRVEVDALALGIFAFAKFLMWRDLDPAAHPGLLTHAPLQRLLDGAQAVAEPPPFADDADVDAAIPVEKLDHVVEVDGSQALAAEAVRRGHSLVIQGPPGTGKSQTIVNILAQAVMDGRSVIFVAEKAAALEVVKRRLEQFGLGAAVLELHSEKQSKRVVLDELRATLALPPPVPPQREAAVQRLGELRGRLNRHAAAMRDVVGETGVTVQEVVGRLAALRASGAVPPPFRLDPAGWDAARLRALREAARNLAASLGGARSPWRGVTAPLDAIAAQRLLAELPRAIRALAAAPGGVAEAEAALAAEALRAEAPMRPEDVPAAEARLADLRLLATPDPRWLPGALEVPGLAAAREVLAKPGGMLGFLDGGRRAAKASLAVALRDPEDGPALDALLTAQAAKARLGAGPDAATLEAQLAWMARHAAAFATPAVTEAQRAALAAWGVIRDATGLAPEASFAATAERLAAMAAEPEALSPWQAWARAEAMEPSLAPLAEALASGALPPDAAEGALDFAILEALLRMAMREHPGLAAFDGAAADRWVLDFRAADAARVRLARAEAAAIHAARVEALRNGEEAASLAFLRGEFERKRGHAPLRTLLSRAAPLVRKAKPILMLSPLSVAQFLANPHHATQPGFPLFDLLVMDEASQIEPVDALGAIARARQVVVVGDDKQMPPTRFFQRMTEEVEEDASEEETALAARDVESILGLANARGIPNAMLRWHYRSRHESLIATSNAEFYGNRLLVLPSPRPRSPSLGLSLVRVEGRFQGSANVVEARAVAEAVLRHARETPGDTLGVAAFSVTQRDAIAEAVEALRRESPETEAFFTAHPAEPFFVKNLENVQGDERDSIMISVGYGRGGDGKLAMRFGPLSNEGGERRLNVLITRAKKRCIVFSGIGAEEVDLERAKGRGVAALKTFLDFAAGGASLRVAAREGSAIAGLIGELIGQSGREAVPRVGLSGLFLDVAARGPQGFDLGVEVDGADWSGLRCARDRDRGRQMALEGMGWSLTRSWSLDWLNQPEAAAAKLRPALGLAAPVAAPVTAARLAPAYVEATLDKPPANRAELAGLIAAIVATEAPVHGDSIQERLRLLLGPAAPDPKGFAGALNEARLLHGITEASGFWFPEERGLVIARDRSAAAAHLRRPAMIHAEEVAAAARLVLELDPQADEEELAQGLARLLGLDPSAVPALAARVAILVGSGQLVLMRGA